MAGRVQQESARKQDHELRFSQVRWSQRHAADAGLLEGSWVFTGGGIGTLFEVKSMVTLLVALNPKP